MAAEDASKVSENRRRLIQGGAALAASLAMPAYVRAQSKEPIRIGHLTPMTGFLGPMGEYAVLGARLAVEEVNASGGVLGRQLELLTEDSVNPQTASTKAQRMVDRDKVFAIVGEISSASGLAISQVTNRAQKLFFQTGCNSNELRGANCSRYMFHLEANNTMYVRTIGQWLLKQGMVKGKRWMAFTADYAFGHDLFQQTKKFMDENGAEFVSNDMIPTDATEFSASMLKIRQQKPDIVISNLAGNQTTNFTKQYHEFGIKVPYAGADMNMTSIWGAGKSAFSGTWPIIWTHQVQAPSAQAFVKRFQERWKKLPENQAVNDYLAIILLAKAMNETKSDDTDTLIKYLETAKDLDVLRERPGYFRDWDHQLMFEMYTVQPAEGGGSGPQDFMVTSDPVPGPGESLEIIAPTREENACKFA
ncbi:MAG TPA: ABC transporter substrate-binding protein [Burkholderiaceae bacterium]|nr:ABC transporter substrate-binding protein [Burkholderiaceae bacterium]